MHSTTRISIYSVVFEIEAKQVLVILFSSSTFPENSREQVKLPLLRANSYVGSTNRKWYKIQSG